MISRLFFSNGGAADPDTDGALLAGGLAIHGHPSDERAGAGPPGLVELPS